MRCSLQISHRGKRIGRVLWIRPGHWALQRVLSGATVVDSAVSIRAIRSERQMRLSRLSRRPSDLHSACTSNKGLTWPQNYVIYAAFSV